MTPKVPEENWRPMTDDERTMALALGKCRFAPATVTKRFARDFAEHAKSPEARVTEKQMAFLRRAVHTFRRQIPAPVVKLAESGRVLRAGEETP